MVHFFVVMSIIAGTAITGYLDQLKTANIPSVVVKQVNGFHGRRCNKESVMETQKRLVTVLADKRLPKYHCACSGETLSDLKQENRTFERYLPQDYKMRERRAIHIMLSKAVNIPHQWDNFSGLTSDLVVFYHETRKPPLTVLFIGRDSVSQRGTVFDGYIIPGDVFALRRSECTSASS